MSKTGTGLTAATLPLAGTEVMYVVQGGNSRKTTAASFYTVGGADVAVADGGTGLSSYTAGDILYATGATTLAKLATTAYGRGLLALANSTALSGELSAFYQPLDADLTSWAGVTRAAGLDTFAATPSSANLKALVTDETGSGALVFATSPTLVTPALGTPTAINLTNATGLTEALAAAAVGMPSPAVASTFLQRNSGNTAYDAKTTAQTRTSLSDGAWPSFALSMTVSGTVASSYFINSWVINDTLVAGGASSADQVSGINLVHSFGGAAVNGTRIAFASTAALTSATASTNTSRNYCGAQFTGVAYATDGGTLPGSAKGAVFGSNPQGALNAGATGFLHVSGTEINVKVETGASVLHKSLAKLASLGSSDAVKGTTTDAMIWFQNQGGAVGWDNGLLFSADSGVQTISTTGTIMATRGSLTVKRGIDLTSWAFSEYSFISSGFGVTGTGTVFANTQMHLSGTAGGNYFAETSTTPTAQGDTIGLLDFGHTAGNIGGRWLARANQAWTLGSAQGTLLSAFVCANGSASMTEVVRIDKSTTAGETSLMLWDVTKGTLQRVVCGAADSGGVGFKMLRVAN
ncbi:hypothetical protein EJ076_34735 [Mesorhizobium sp. M7D.F.Ca.US.005.01.1.1]|uniref:hypothetical protein n=1 Tax=Mesorhizobium sp. M7D.F.Ca.US.005.01.1.1 TaxID=2493678 RepID=UPI000F754FB6|nr:hypothetical protein [Mesorhizobium sp. M7D.F.Ca.US.005.01.1.1]AZO45877.1 hypothetical protein EJ076_34735 [Mesorhizobium sp. M7D.F.Ca.US.005.01.1.1]